MFHRLVCLGISEFTEFDQDSSPGTEHLTDNIRCVCAFKNIVFYAGVSCYLGSRVEPGSYNGENGIIIIAQ